MTWLRRHRIATLAALSMAALLGAAVALAATGETAHPPIVGAARPVPRGLTATFRRGPYRIVIRLTPNRSALPESLSIRLLQSGRPVDGARIRATLSMTGMQDMGRLTTRLPQTHPGTYARTAPTLMTGSWLLQLHITPPAGPALSVQVDDPVGT